MIGQQENVQTISENSEEQYSENQEIEYGQYEQGTFSQFQCSYSIQDQQIYQKETKSNNLRSSDQILNFKCCEQCEIEKKKYRIENKRIDNEIEQIQKEIEFQKIKGFYFDSSFKACLNEQIKKYEQTYDNFQTNSILNINKYNQL